MAGMMGCVLFEHVMPWALAPAPAPEMGAAWAQEGGVGTEEGEDLSGDEVGDKVEGDGQADPNGMSNSGRVTVRSGVGNVLLATLRGGSAGDRFGASVATVGDVNLDGDIDLLVGAPRAEELGRVYLFFGPFKEEDDGTIQVMNLTTADADWVFEPNYLDNEEYGYAVAPLYDFDGDGFADLRIMAWAQLEGGSEASRTYIYSGNLAGWSEELGPFLIGTLTGPMSWQLWMTVPGDMDGNGAVDNEDILRLTANLNLAGTASEPLSIADGDLNNDNVVDADDLALLMNVVGYRAYADVQVPGSNVGFCGINTTTGQIVGGEWCTGSQGTGHDRPGGGSGGAGGGNGNGNNGGNNGGNGNGTGIGGGGANCMTITTSNNSDYICVGETVCLHATLGGGGVYQPCAGTTWSVTESGPSVGQGGGGGTSFGNGLNTTTAGPGEDPCVTVEEAGEYVITASYCGQCTGTKRVRAGTGLALTITFERHQESNWPIDSNPNTGGGEKIYPDKVTIYDQDDGSSRDNRATVNLNATLHPPQVGITIYAIIKDVDDPSCSTTTSGGTDVGNDNISNISRDLQLFGATNSEGVAALSFAVSPHPGDNYKVYATTCQAALNDITVEMMSEAAELPPGVYSSEMLTVWRHCFVEVDEMTGPSDTNFNWKQVTITNIEDATGLTPLSASHVTGFTTPSGMLNEVMTAPNFTGTYGLAEGGAEIWFGIRNSTHGKQIKNPASPEPFIIIANDDHHANLWPPQSLIPAGGFKATLHDDDGIFGDNFSISCIVSAIAWDSQSNEWQLQLQFATPPTPSQWDDVDNDGFIVIDDGGENMRLTTVSSQPIVHVSSISLPVWVHDDDDDALLPATGYLDCSLAETTYSVAYVTIVAAGGGMAQYCKTEIPFTSHMNTTYPFSIVEWCDPFRESKPFERSDCWIAYLYSGFQAHGREDDDGGEVLSFHGSTPGGRNVSVIIMETIREYAPDVSHTKRITIAHELGHQLGLADNAYGGLMDHCNSSDLSDNECSIIRHRVESPGDGN